MRRLRVVIQQTKTMELQKHSAALFALPQVMTDLNISALILGFNALHSDILRLILVNLGKKYSYLLLLIFEIFLILH